MFKIIQYRTEDGQIPFNDWLRGLRDREARAMINVRLNRVRLGNLGDSKSVGGGIQELRIHHGPGYRLYFALHGKEIVVLLLGGYRSTQANDIKLAQEYWTDFKRRR